MQTACGKPSPQPDTGGGGSDPVGAPGGEAVVFDVGDCGPDQRPQARRYHQMAYVDAEEAFTLPDGRSTHRGVLLIGGQTPDETTALNDQWFLDLHDPLDLYACDWVKLPDVTFLVPHKPSPVVQQRPTWGASLVFTQGDRLKLVGGYQLRDGGTIASSPDVWTALGVGAPFQAPSSELSVDAAQVLVGDGTCNENVVECKRTRYNSDGTGGVCTRGSITLASGSPCTGTFSYPGSGPSDTFGPCPTADHGLAQSNHLPDDYKPACRADPYCNDDDNDGAPDGNGVEERPMFGWGRGFAAVAYDPTQDALSVHGGTTGCSGTDAQCLNWLAMLRVDGEVRPALQPDPYFATASDFATTGWDYGWACSKARPASHGVHHAQGVTLGLTWDPTTRFWSGTAATYVVGGTRFQVVPPGWEHLTGTTLRQYEDCPPQSEDTGSATPCKPNICADEELPGGRTGEVTQVIPNCANDSLDEAVVTGTVAEFNGTSYLEVTDFERVHSAAAAPISPDQLAIVGGRNAAGSATGAYLVDVLGNANTVDGSFLARYGAAAVGDPLYGRVLYFGGHATDTDVGVITTDETRSDALVNSGAWGMSDVRVDLEWDPATSVWSVNQEMNLTYDCDQTVQDPCWADTLTVMYQTLDPENDLWTAGALKMEIDLGNGWRPLKTYRTPTGTDVTTQTHVRFALPRVVGDGATVRVKLTGWRRDEGLPVVGFEDAMKVTGGRWAQGVRPFTFGDPAANGWMFAGIPMWTVDATGEAPVVRLAQLNVTAPAGLAIVATGVPQQLGVVHDVQGRSFNHYTDTAPVIADRSALAILLQGVTYVGVVSTADAFDPGTAVHAWRDQLLDERERDDVFAYVNTDGEAGLLGDVLFLESRLGPLEAPDPEDPSRTRVLSAIPVLFARPEATTSAGGIHWDGVSVVQNYTAQGSGLGGDVGDHATALHELAHTWFGSMRRSVPPLEDVSWLLEGMPTLLETMRYRGDSNFEGRDALEDALHSVEVLRGAPDTTSLIRAGADVIRYDFAAYTLAQYHHVARGTGTDADVWRRWRALLHAKPFGATLDETELRSAIGDPFYEEWIEHGRVGTPLLKLSYAQVDLATDVVYNPATPLNMCQAASPDRLVVKQVQEELYGTWHLFQSVPYFIACPDENDSARRAIVECDGTGVALDTPHDNSDFDANNDGVAEATRSTIATPAASNIPDATVAVLSAHLLIPEHVLDPAYGRLVEVAKVTGVCLQTGCLDNDHDCWPGDCDDNDATVNPGATDIVGAPDQDCDGWGLQ